MAYPEVDIDKLDIALLEHPLVGIDELDIELSAVAPEAPTVRTDPATNIGETSARLNGELTSMGSEDSVDVSFEYRVKGEAYWDTTVPQALIATGVFYADVTGLDPDTEYEFRAVGEYDYETVYGDITEFTTLAPVAVQTNSATSVTEDSARLNGTLTSIGEQSEVDVYFNYREQGEPYWITTTPETLTETGTFNFDLADLTGGTTYEFQAVVEWDYDQETGAVLEFTTTAVEVKFNILLMGRHF